MFSTITKFALFSRFVAVVFQCVTNWLVPDHDAEAFRLRPLSYPTEGDKLVQFILDGYNKWDGSYYLTISEEGYTQPQMFAFLPLFPALVRSLASLIAVTSIEALSFRSCIMISSFFINISLFVISANLIHQLAQRILKDNKMAFATAILFCFNPAAVFMSANYTECLFCTLTLWGMLALQDQSFVLSVILFGLSGATRSNGVVSFGFLIYYWTQQLTRNTLVAVSIGKTNVYLFIVLQSLKIALILCGMSTFIFGPFLLFQFYSFAEICHFKNFTFPTTVFEYLLPVNGDTNIIPSSTVPQWCHKAIPIPYSNIQADVWEVGLFNYFQLRKVPNFILALPVIMISLGAIVGYCKQNWEYVKWLGLLPRRKTWDKYAKSQGFFNEESFLHLAHLSFLLLFGVIFMHIEVLTRFLFSSCPIIVMFAAHLTTNGPDMSFLKGQGPQTIMDTIRVIIGWFKGGTRSKFIVTYFLAYFVFGLVLHCNFFPWT